ncbi:unnamed protein product [Lepidochelys olivacea]
MMIFSCDKACFLSGRKCSSKLALQRHMGIHVRSLSNVKSALMPQLMQAPCADISGLTQVRGPTNAKCARTVESRRRAWTSMCDNITLVRHLAVVFAAILPLTSNSSGST